MTQNKPREQHFLAGSDLRIKAGNVTLKYGVGEEILLHRDSESGAFIRHFSDDGSVVEVNINRLPGDLFQLFDNVVLERDELDEEISFESVPLRNLTENGYVSTTDLLVLASEENYEFDSVTSNTMINGVPVRRRHTSLPNKNKLEGLKETASVARTKNAIQRNLHSIEVREVGSINSTGYLVDRASLAALRNGHDARPTRDTVVEFLDELSEVKLVALDSLQVRLSESYDEDDFFARLQGLTVDFTLVEQAEGEYLLRVGQIEDVTFKDGEDFTESFLDVTAESCCNDEVSEEVDIQWQNDEEDEDDDDDGVEIVWDDGEDDMMESSDEPTSEESESPITESNENEEADNEESVIEEGESNGVAYSQRLMESNQVNLIDVWKSVENMTAPEVKAIKRQEPSKKVSFVEGVPQSRLVCSPGFDLVEGADGPVCISVSDEEFKKLAALHAAKNDNVS